MGQRLGQEGGLGVSNDGEGTFRVVCAQVTLSHQETHTNAYTLLCKGNNMLLHKTEERKGNILTPDIREN